MSTETVEVEQCADDCDDNNVATLLEGMELAWGLIANAWSVADQVEGWEKAAEEWRDKHWTHASSQIPKFQGEDTQEQPVV